MKPVIRLACALMFVAVGLLFQLSPTYAYGSEGGEDVELDCVSAERVKTLRYFFVENPPIPAGEEVEFVAVCDSPNVLAIQWEHKVGRGIRTHYFRFSGVAISLVLKDWVGNSQPMTPEIGTRAIVDHYVDIRLQDDITNGSDGVADSVYLEVVREVDPAEEELIDLAHQFEAEAIERNFFYMTLGGDCPPSVFLMDGQPIQNGPYGNTYMVPENGGTLTAIYSDRGYCGGATSWDMEVDPGMEIVSRETQAPISNTTPHDFCQNLENMVPQWQPQVLPVYLRDSDLCYLTHSGSTVAYHTFKREGWVGLNREASSADFVAYVYRGGQHTDVVNTMPEPLWESAGSSFVVAEGVTYTLGIDEEGRPQFQQVGNQYPSALTYYVQWGSPFLFISYADDWNAINWRNYQTYRVRNEGGQAIVEKAIWPEVLDFN